MEIHAKTLLPRVKILLLGASGRVGTALSAHLANQGHDLLRPSHAELDLAAPDALAQYLRERENAPPGAVVNCAAVSSLETCLDDPVRAHLLNAMMPETLARFCNREQIKLIHFSTDYVLDGRRPGKKTETAKCRPVNTYGESKWEAELRIADLCPSAVITRVSWVFGSPSHPAFPEQILAKALQGVPLSAIDDKYSLPTSTDTICGAVEQLLLTPSAEGILHLCDSGDPVSWYDIAETVLNQAEELGFPLKSRTLSRQKLEQIPFFRDARPPHTAMDNSRLSALTGESPPLWQNSLKQALKKLLPRLNA